MTTSMSKRKNNEMTPEMSIDSEETMKRIRRNVEEVKENEKPGVRLWCKMLLEDSCYQKLPIVPEAEELKKQGDRHLKLHELQSGIECYTAALAKQRNPEYYCQRASCYFSLHQYKEAQADASATLEYTTDLEACFILLRSSILIGDTVNADIAVTLFRTYHRRSNISKEEMDVTTLKIVSAEVNTLMPKKEYMTAIVLCGRALNIAQASITFKLLKAECLLYLNKAGEAITICFEVAQTDKTCERVYYIHALCLFVMDNLDEAINVLTYAPVKSALLTGLLEKLQTLIKVRAEAENNMKRKLNIEARDGFTECLRIMEGIEPKSVAIEGKIYHNLSVVEECWGSLDTSLDWANKSVTASPDCLETVLHRGHIHKKKKLFRNAIQDYKRAKSLDPGNDTYTGLINEVKKAAATPPPKCGGLYHVLGVSPSATQEQIKAAYKKLALTHHPDKHSEANAEVKRVQETKFQLISKAYKTLSNVVSRREYDRALRHQYSGI